jgi:hypothetical protein
MHELFQPTGISSFGSRQALMMVSTTNSGSSIAAIRGAFQRTNGGTTRCKGGESLGRSCPAESRESLCPNSQGRARRTRPCVVELWQPRPQQTAGRELAQLRLVPLLERKRCSLTLRIVIAEKSRMLLYCGNDLTFPYLRVLSTLTLHGRLSTNPLPPQAGQSSRRAK